MSRSLILGATGNIGSQVARQLLGTGAAVRVGARTPQKASDLATLGAEVVHFDFDHPSTWSTALEGVQRLFLVAPSRQDFAHPIGELLRAAVAAGVEQVVKLSAMGVSVEAPFALARQHALADEAVAASGLQHTILRPTFFMDNFFGQHAHTIRADGAFYGASAGGAVAYVSSADIASVAVAALTHPAEHNGQTYVITGARVLTDAQAAGLIGDLLGRDVTYVDLSAEQLGAGMADAGLPEWLVEALVGLEQVKAQGWASAVSPTVQQVLDRAPESFEDFLRRTQG